MFMNKHQSSPLQKMLLNSSDRSRTWEFENYCIESEKSGAFEQKEHDSDISKEIKVDKSS